MNSFEKTILLKRSDGAIAVLPYDDISKEFIDIKNRLYEEQKRLIDKEIETAIKKIANK